MKKQRDIFSIRQKKNPAIFTYCDIIYTKAYRFEISGEEQVSGRMPWEIVNTTLSKANNIEISNAAIDLKTEIEKIREQIQNIE